jgi:DNA-binding NarL/FixJ family response regulator
MKQEAPIPDNGLPIVFPVRVALVEDQPKIREDWSLLINSMADFQCLCACATGEEALRVIPANRPDIILMDIRLPGMSGIECTSRMRELLPQTQVIILTALDDDELVFRALQAGADGYLLKRTRPEDLRAALLEVLSGGAPMSNSIARQVVQSFRKPASKASKDEPLTTREEEVLQMLAKGYSNKEIADRIQLSIETVRGHLKHIYRKMHVRCRTEAVIHRTDSAQLRS